MRRRTRAVLNTWNETRAEFLDDATLHELIRPRQSGRCAQPVVAEAGVTAAHAELDRRAMPSPRASALGVERIRRLP
jgi:hypothetical protein